MRARAFELHEKGKLGMCHRTEMDELALLGKDIERAELVLMLRAVCDHYGDNEWEDDLHLGDVVEKHLMKYLDEDWVRRPNRPLHH